MLLRGARALRVLRKPLQRKGVAKCFAKSFAKTFAKRIYLIQIYINQNGKAFPESDVPEVGQCQSALGLRRLGTEAPALVVLVDPSTRWPSKPGTAGVACVLRLGVETFVNDKTPRRRFA